MPKTNTVNIDEQLIATAKIKELISKTDSKGISIHFKNFQLNQSTCHIS